MIHLAVLGWPLRLRARRHARAAEWAAAAAIYRRMLALGIGGARDRVQLGHALMNAGEIAAAEATYRAATAAFPLRLDPQRQLGRFLRLHGSAEEAADVLARALALEPDARAIGDELDEMGFTGGALDERMIAGILGGVTVPPPRRWSGHSARGRSLLARGQAEAAVRAFRQALIRAPRKPAGYVALGAALIAAGRRRAGIQAYLTAWNLQPGRQDAAAALADAGWTRDDLARLTRRAWGYADPAAPEGLSPRERAIWARLAHATGYGD